MKSPFPWFGGKSRVAHLVWDRFGDVPNYVEPFAGSMAVLLARETPPRLETVNDADCYLANFWRALKADPDGLADHADWPVNEADLHARHNWLVNQSEFRERMKTDPDHFDAKVAGWWVWGLCQWIGSGWCVTDDRQAGRQAGGETNAARQRFGNGRPPVQLPSVRKMGIHSDRCCPPRHVSCQGSGMLESGAKTPAGWGGASGNPPSRRLPKVGHNDPGGRLDGLREYFHQLAARLRRVRVCCGDWARVATPAVTFGNGLTGVLLDPPYASERDDVYGALDSFDVAHDVRKWAIENGDNPEMRIALCGYEGEHQMPDSWECIAWKANGGYANQGAEGTTGKANARKERIWFSPHCLRPQASLFADLDRCDRELAEIEARLDLDSSPAYLSTMGRADWEHEKQLISEEAKGD